LSAWKCGIIKYDIEVIFSGMTSVLNFIIIWQLVQKLLGDIRRTDIMAIS
jgi:hypothetical protein